MKITIQKKILLIYLCTIIIIMMVSGTYIVYETEARDVNSLINTIQNIAETTENMGRYNLNKVLDSNRDNYEICILDSDGNVEATNNPHVNIGNKEASSIVIECLTTGQKVTSSTSHFETLYNKTGGHIEHARPVLSKEGNIEYVIYVKASTSNIYYNMLSIIKIICMGLVFAMIITTFCAIGFSKMITAPIKTLTKNSKRLATGDAVRQIPVEAEDEIGELTKSFNFMATELVTTMEKLTSEKNKLEKIFENMADGVTAFNRQGSLIHMNAACLEILGKDRIGNNFEEFMKKLEIDLEFEKLLEGEKYKQLDECINIDDKYLKIQCAAYANAKQEPDGLVVVIQDVTKQQKLDQMRKEFVANVSHELRTPLTTVKIYTETLLDGAIDDKDNAMHFLEVMNKEADRMTALVQDLLELSRIDNKQIQLTKAQMDMRDIVEDVIEAQQINLARKEQKLEVNYDEEIPYRLIGDSHRIRQVLHNILSNAIKYTEEKGIIVINMYKDNGRIKVEVIDNGMGIPEEDLKRVFERFYRVDKARSRKMGGTGLGLSIARELMLLHDGDIIITSKLGEGTKVVLDFEEYIPN